jgi:hypothetical protein
MVWRLRWRLLTYQWGICRSLQAGAWNISPVGDGVRVIDGSKRRGCGRRRVQSSHLSAAKYSPPPRGCQLDPAAHPSSTASCVAGLEIAARGRTRALMGKAYVRSSGPEGPEYVYLPKNYSPLIHNKCQFSTKFY